MGELWHEGSQQDLAKPVGDLEEKWKLVPAYLQVKKIFSESSPGFREDDNHVLSPR